MQQQQQKKEWELIIARAVVAKTETINPIRGLVQSIVVGRPANAEAYLYLRNPTPIVLTYNKVRQVLVLPSTN